MDYKPLDENFEEKVRRSWAKQGFLHTIGARMEKIEAGMCEVHLPYREELTQSHGFFHGSVIGAIADVSGGYAAYSLTPPGSQMLTVEYKINFLNPGLGEKLVARGYVDKFGKTLSVCRSEIYSVEDGEETLCATAQMTMMTLSE